MRPNETRRKSLGSVVYGINAVRAALANPRRSCIELRLQRADLARELNAPAGTTIRVTPSPGGGLLPNDAVHQGVVGLFTPLSLLSIEDAFDALPFPGLMLDGITDPRNTGAMLRSCAAFGLRSLIVQDRRAPDINTPALLKTACGGAEQVPVYAAVNLARTLQELREHGVLCVGLAAEADAALPSLTLPEHTVFVIGAEGDGLRRLVRERCDLSASIPVRPGTGGLNAGIAASVAMYEYRRQHPLNH